MADKSATPEVMPDDPATPPAPPVVPPKRSPGHRGADVKDTVAEMTAKAHEISLEAGSKMAAAMKDVINAAAGITGFVLESARDLAQYMVRRGQMTQEEADKLIRQAEEAQANRGSDGTAGAFTPSPSSLATDEDDNATRQDEVSDDYPDATAADQAGDEAGVEADSGAGSEEAARPGAKTAAKQTSTGAKSATPATKSKTVATEEKPTAKKVASAPASSSSHSAAKKGTTKGK